jgi:hypothetical protein
MNGLAIPTPIDPPPPGVARLRGAPNRVRDRVDVKGRAPPGG